MNEQPDIVDGESVDYKPTRIEQVHPESIDNVEAFPSYDAGGRINQQRMLPAAVQQRLLGSIISSNPNSTALGTGKRSATVIIPNSTSVIFNFTVSNDQGRILIAIPDVSIYINGSGPANVWPNADFAMGNFPITTYNSWAQTNNKNVVTQFVARNNSGADVTAFVVVRWRLITDPVTTANNGDNS